MPRPAGGPCLLPLPVTAMPANDSISPEEAWQGMCPPSFSGVTTPSSCRHRLCSQSQTPPGSPPPLEKQTRALDAYFRRDFPFPAQQRGLMAVLAARASCTQPFLSWEKCSRAGCWGRALVQAATAAWPGAAPHCSLEHKRCRVGTALPSQWGSSLQMPVYFLQDIPSCGETCLTRNLAGPAPPQSQIDLWVTHDFSDAGNGGTKYFIVPSHIAGSGLPTPMGDKKIES